MEKNKSSEEIDLGYLFRKSNDFLKSIVRSFFLIIAFFKRHAIVLIVIIAVGFAFGFYKDYNAVEVYNNKLIIIPNFQSVDYLYDKVDAINSKIKIGDSVYLKSIVGKQYRELKSIKLEPIVDIYNFLSNKDNRNFDVFRALTEKKDISEFLEDMSTSKYYKYHSMDILIKGDTSSEKIVKDLIAFLNQNEHFAEYQDIFKNSNQLEISEHYKMLAQVDSLVSSSSAVSGSNANIAINNTTNLFSLIQQKREILKEIVQLKMQQVDYSAPIREVSANYNLETKRFLNISNKIRFPILLVLAFCGVYLFLYLLRKLRSYAKIE